jgi:PAS domain-containing protein
VAPEAVEMILLKQLASCLRMPIALMGPEGNVLFFNEPAESIFGFRFEETDELDADELAALLTPSDAAGIPLKDEERPLVRALLQRVPGHRTIFIRGAGTRREIEVTGLPLLATGDRFLGALSFFWETGRPSREARPEPPSESGQQALETILTRRIASTLTTPVFLVDPAGHLLYFNPAAEPILGQSFAGTGLASRDQLYNAFVPRDDAGKPIAPDDHPLSRARHGREPVHQPTVIRALDGRDRRIAITAIPLIGQSDRLVGAFGVFWEAPS